MWGCRYCFFSVREDSAAKMLTGSGQVETKELIRIDPRKKYRLSAEIETAVPAEYYIGLIPYDGERRQIESVHFHIRPGTETTLLKLCKVQDTVLLVDNASKWVPGKGSAVVFDADDSGNYNDLPNFNIAREVVSKTKQPDGSWVNYNYDWMFKPGAMKQVAEYADGIGPDYHMLIEETSQPGNIKLTGMVQDAQQNKLVVHPYTVRSDKLPEYTTDVNQLYDALYNKAGVNGLFTDFPDKAVKFLNKE